MMRFLRENGIIDQPITLTDEVSGKERLAKVETRVERTTYHVPLFGCWAYINGLEPREAKARKAELMAGDYQSEMIGMTFRVSHNQTTVRGESVLRGVAIDTDSGCVMGTMPEKFDSESLPTVNRIISTFEYDGKLVAVCEDATE